MCSWPNIRLVVMVVWALGAASIAEARDHQPSEIIRIWPGAAPGTESWTGPEVTTYLTQSPYFTILPGEKLEMVTNVTIPTLTMYRPVSGNSIGTSIIVLPGGGFMDLAVRHEGYDIGKWLAESGITAFVLKYRVQRWEMNLATDAAQNPDKLGDAMRAIEPHRKIAVADAIQAIRFLRKNAQSLGIDPDKIGMIGFSAGGITTMGVLQEAPAADRPNFAASIYGIMGASPAPKDVPPLFIASAQDDPIVPPSAGIAMLSAWTAVGRPAELHIYEAGGHSFGSRHLGKPVDRWMEAFSFWLAGHGWIAESARSHGRPK